MLDSKNNNIQRQFIYTCPSKVFDDPSLTINELKIYMMIRSFMDTTGIAYPSNNWIAEKLGINRRNTIININKLIDKGFIERIEANGRRYLRIKVSNCIEEVVSQTTPPSVVDDTPPSVAKDTQLNQSNIISKNSYIYRANSEKTDNLNKKKSINPVPYQQTCYQTQNDNDQQNSNSIKFHEFWTLYPVKKNKARTQCAWNSQKCELIADEIIEKLKQQIKEDCQFIEGYAPTPSNYIMQERWNDEIQKRIKKNSPKDIDHDSTEWATKFHEDLF